MSFIATRIRTTPLLLVLLTALLAIVAGRAQAQINPLWDHYKAYGNLTHPRNDQDVTLTDQFQSFVNRVQYLDWFANPVEKRHDPLIYPIHRPELHYAWYQITQRPLVPRDVIATDQFGDHLIHVGRETYLLNPALKNAPAGTPLPVANHYLCYECTGNPVDVPLILTDQFFTRPTSHLVPRYFCNPVQKVTSSGAVYPIMDPAQHYLVYDMTDFTSQIWTATYSDQFLQNQPVQLIIDRLLMVPSLKQLPTESATSTWGRLKSLYR